MHVKEQVKELVHDVKRKFSKKHRRESNCSTCADSHDGASSYSSVDTIGILEDSSSSSGASSRPGTPERGRFKSLLHPRNPSRNHNHNLFHKAKRLDGKRYRLFSAPTIPSSRIDASSISSHRQVATEPASTPKGSLWKARSAQGMTRASSSVARDYPDVLDISSSIVGKSTRDSSCQTPPHFDIQSEISGTLVNTDLYSDASSVLPLSSLPSLDQMLSDQVPVARHEEITLLPSVPSPSPRPPNLDNPTVAPLIPQPSRPVSPVQPMASTSASPPPVCIPRLTAPSMFLPIPNTDPLNALLTKYVPAEQRPPRDVAGEYAGSDVHEMVMSNSWRALAKMARDRIVASDPEDLARILDLWSLRLSSLARLRLTNQASAECTNLFAVLNAVIPPSVPGSFPGPGMSSSLPVPSSPAPVQSLPQSPSGLSGLAQLPGTPSHGPSAPLSGTSPTTTRAPRQSHATHELVHPFELTVFHARVHYWSGDPLGYVDGLSRILGQCKERAREEARVIAQRWELGRVVSPRERGDVAEASRSEEVSESEEAHNEEDEGEENTGGSTDTEAQDDAEEQDILSASQSEEAHNEEDEGEEDAGGSTDTEAQDDAEEQDVLSASQSEEAHNEQGVGEEESTDTEAQGEEDGKEDNVLVAAEANLSMWLERVARVCLMLASQMIEMNDYQASINLLAPLCTQRIAPTFQPTPSPELHSALARIYLLSGNLSKAEEHFLIAGSATEHAESDTVAMNTALMAAAFGDWTRAEEALADIVAKQPENLTATNNLAVTLLCQGRIKQGIDLLETALRTSPSAVVVAEPFLFNLSTMYELRSTAAIDKKRELLIEVAKWSGDGLKTSCLKMPSG